MPRDGTATQLAQFDIIGIRLYQNSQGNLSMCGTY